MAPIKDETVDGLKETISKLESRMAELEQRILHGEDAGKRKSAAKSMRMILMGPPGAGV